MYKLEVNAQASKQGDKNRRNNSIGVQIHEHADHQETKEPCDNVNSLCTAQSINNEEDKTVYKQEKLL